MKQPQRFNPIIGHVILMVVGLILVVFGLHDVLFPPDDGVIMMEKTEDSTGFYLIFGLLLMLAGFLGIRKVRQEGIRKKW